MFPYPQHLDHPLWQHDVNPANPNRTVLYIQWNGQADGPNVHPPPHKECGSCFQMGKVRARWEARVA